MRPNILFIMTDQQRFDTFSMNNPVIKTPNFDKLIGESIFFKNAYCSNPSCVPSRAAIMTGKMPSECQCPAYITELPIEETTFMARLRDNCGYHTAVIGKQHFAESKIDKGYVYENIIDGHGAFAKDATVKKYIDFLESNGIDPETIYKKSCISGGEWLVDEKYHLDNFIGDLGKEWISNQDSTSETPWFFTLSFPGPHHPYDLEGTKYSDMYKLEDMTLPETSFEDLAQKPPHFTKMDSYANIYLKDYTKEQFQKSKRAYYANMSLIDEKVGEVIALLKEKDLYDNTLIFFTSDHGDFMGDFGMVEKLQCLTDSLMRVPMFIKPPVKDFEACQIDDEILNIDIASTCLNCAEGEVPELLSNFAYNCYWDKNYEMKKRPYIFMEARDIKGVLIDGIKVVSYINRDYGEIYDMNKDKKEVTNLWNEPAYQEIKTKALQIIINEMYKSIPKHEIVWNYGTPEI
ncbi:MAG: sulfatase-like hydrolase/transferase [Clostridia bacterium]